MLQALPSGQDEKRANGIRADIRTPAAAASAVAAPTRSGSCVTVVEHHFLVMTQAGDGFAAMERCQTCLCMVVFVNQPHS